MVGDGVVGKGSGGGIYGEEIVWSSGPTGKEEEIWNWRSIFGGTTVNYKWGQIKNGPVSDLAVLAIVEENIGLCC